MRNLKRAHRAAVTNGSIACEGDVTATSVSPANAGAQAKARMRDISRDQPKLRYECDVAPPPPSLCQALKAVHGKRARVQ
jgi:hypothetical protein